MTNDPISLPHYNNLAEQEAQFWGGVRPSTDNPQLWDDPLLFDLFLKPQWDLLIQTVAAIGGNVLELGCGEGHLAIELAKRGVHVRGFDLSSERIARAKELSHLRLAETPDCIPDFRVADLNVEALPQSEYDVVVAHDALHHIYALDRLLDQVRVTLKPNGKLVVYDYIGMGTLRKITAAVVFAVLPTYQPYRMKIKLLNRLGTFLRSERGKREQIERGSGEKSNGSPFEEISQGSIVAMIESKFSVITKSYSHPFFFYLAPKLRLPRSVRGSCARMFSRLDEGMSQLKLARGAYVFIVADKRS